jgi:hypothetical protein
MELPRLAAKQKRYKDLLHYATTERIDPVTRPRLLTTLKGYQVALAACWTSKGGTPEDELKVATLERQLEDLFNNARLRSSAP